MPRLFKVFFLVEGSMEARGQGPQTSQRSPSAERSSVGQLVCLGVSGLPNHAGCE